MTVSKQTQGTPRRQGRDAMARILVQSETMSETNPQGKDTDAEKLQETIRLMRKELEKITSENKDLKQREAENQGGTPMYSVGTREGEIKILVH